jgi:AI-2 transport protein TqsA
LSFLLNFIPNVGSMIAMVLPLPIVIVDDNLSTFQKVGAFAGPGAVQGYVGNALEPMLFGKSLNMTPLSILAALVIWGSLWGLLGAILSVPLLGIQKILLQRTNHPIAKYCVMLIREDPTIDEAAEQ